MRYTGPSPRQDTAHNLPFHVGDKFILWEKVIKEIKNKRYVGPFKCIPFTKYVQSPIGLVPKVNGETRLIFHLSYDFPKSNRSVNYYTPHEKCTVKYNNLDHAVRQSLQLLRNIFFDLTADGNVLIWYGKTDIKSAFCLLPLTPEVFWLMVMQATHPITHKKFYFMDKCLPFGHSISCALFQAFSDALAHLIRYILEKRYGIPRPSLTNYLDDFLFAALMKALCDLMLNAFLKLCDSLGEL